MTEEQRKQTEQHVAYHEAGHFVAACALGFHEQIIAVNITPRATTGADGEDIISAGENEWHNGGRRGHEPRERVEQRVVLLYAGCAAELRLDPSRVEAAKHGATPDDWYARQLLLSDVFPGRSLERVAEEERALRDRSEKLIEENWAAVRVLADELLLARRVTGEEAAAIVRPHLRGGLDL